MSKKKEEKVLSETPEKATEKDRSKSVPVGIVKGWADQLEIEGEYSQTHCYNIIPAEEVKKVVSSIRQYIEDYC